MYAKCCHSLHTFILALRQYNFSKMKSEFQADLFPSLAPFHNNEHVTVATYMHFNLPKKPAKDKNFDGTLSTKGPIFKFLMTEYCLGLKSSTLQHCHPQ